MVRVCLHFVRLLLLHASKLLFPPAIVTQALWWVVHIWARVKSSAAQLYVQFALL